MTFDHNKKEWERIRHKLLNTTTFSDSPTEVAKSMLVTHLEIAKRCITRARENRQLSTIEVSEYYLDCCLASLEDIHDKWLARK